MKVLYAEDDLLMQKKVAYSLIRMGHEVITTDNGKEAIDTLNSESFDFVILDVFMPYQSGIEVARFIRNDLNLNVPIIILSRSSEEHLVEQATEIGVNEYITKPIEPDILLLKMKKYKGKASG